MFYYANSAYSTVTFYEIQFATVDTLKDWDERSNRVSLLWIVIGKASDLILTNLTRVLIAERQFHFLIHLSRFEPVSTLKITDASVKEVAHLDPLSAKDCRSATADKQTKGSQHTCHQATR